jgi:hypothetical protein
MGALEKVMELQKQGLQEAEISQKLKEIGYSPKDISDAIGQSKVKSAIYGDENYNSNPPSASEMQPSIMTQEINQENIPPEQQPPTLLQQTSSLPPQTPPYSPYPEYPQPQYQPSPGQYQGYQPEYSPASMAVDTETISDIAEQIADEKTSQLKSQIKDLIQINSLMKSKIENFDERLKRIESVMDEIQISIIKKVGTFGEDISNMRKEMSMFEDSFSKIVNPFLDKARKENPKR